MAKSTSTDHYRSYADDDSGIGIDFDNASSSDLTSSASTRLESSPTLIPQSNMSSPLPTIRREQDETKAFIRFASDGVVERIRPATMRNSENGDYVLCQTDRGTYVAHRVPIVPEWVKQLVAEVQAREQ